MSARVDLYDSAYANYASEVYRRVRMQTYGEDFGQWVESWVESWVETWVKCACQYGGVLYVDGKLRGMRP
jgi:hypothetical protein